MISYLCYVTFDDVPDYEKRGWIVVSGLYGHHGSYSVLMEYKGEGEPS